MISKFKTATDFRKSLEARLQMQAEKSGEDLQRLRRKVAFDRFLARVFYQDMPDFYLKGGYAMELRIAKARATKDIDLTCLIRLKNVNDLLSEIIRSDLQSIARIDLNDHFFYQIGESQIDLENAPYGGARYPVICLLDGKTFVNFQVDVGLDFLLDQVEEIQGANWLEFSAIPAPTISMISIEQQFAEKLHAYTLPRAKPNSRVQDLVDMVLLINMRKSDPQKIFPIIVNVFEKRATHPLPQKLERPPVEWEPRFKTMATECGLPLSMETGFQRIVAFYDNAYKSQESFVITS